VDKYRNIYRVRSSRASWWNYANNAAYFVTICTKDRLCFLGDIKRGIVRLSDLGEIACERWHEIPMHFPFVKLGEFVVMPNHIHGIIIIDKSYEDDSPRANNSKIVEKGLIPSLQSGQSFVPYRSGGVTGSKNPMFHMNLSRIIRWYKGVVTFESRKTNPAFGWQFRFHDRIIRDMRNLDRVSSYIANNPAKWHTDKLNSK